jgi:hypothetical protein
MLLFLFCGPPRVRAGAGGLVLPLLFAGPLAFVPGQGGLGAPALVCWPSRVLSGGLGVAHGSWSLAFRGVPGAWVGAVSAGLLLWWGG